MYDIVGFDLPCMDLNVNIPALPTPDTGASVQQLSWQGGGKVATGMVAAARLGAKCAMMGAVGDDIFGRFCIADFKRHGINTESMTICERGDTSLSIVLSAKATSSRSFVYKHGNAAHTGLSEEEIRKIKGAKLLFVSHMSESVQQAMKIAKEAGVKVLIDADGYHEDLPRLLPYIDVFIGSEAVYKVLYGEPCFEGNTLMESCKELSAKGPYITAFTFGERGCAVYSAGDFFVQPAFDVDVVDTVGAGDVFHGAFAAALTSGKTVRECARFASGASAVKITRIGGRAGIPDLKTLELFLENGTIDYKEIDERVRFYERGIEHV